MTESKRLTDKQKAFVSHYLGEARGNATKAARMAGYASPRVEGCRLLIHADIAAEIKAALDDLRAEGILAKTNRLEDYAELRRRLWAVITDREHTYASKGEALEAAESMFTVGGSSRVIGGDSGLVIKKLNVVGTGRHQRVIEEYQLDTGLITQLLNVDRQAAQELGEWSEKRQISGPNDGPIEVQSAESATEKLIAWLAQEDAAEQASEGAQEPQG
jgi:hypothetical protein